MSTIVAPFRPRARLLQLLGDELIGNARLAVFELVKNAYDADANEVVVRLDIAGDAPPSITVTDDGHGMGIETIRDVWLVPGDDHRHRERQRDQRTPKHHRIPIGEKGVGRFAVHKLGNSIELVTRAADSEECVVTIDWQHLVSHDFLDEALVTIATRAPRVFLGATTGTRIMISELRSAWTRGEVRRLARQLTSLCSPFRRTVSGFRATLHVPGRESFLTDIPDVAEILQRAIWTFDFSLTAGVFEWFYEFRGVPGLRVARRTKDTLGQKTPLMLPVVTGSKVVADAETTRGIGEVHGEFHVYDRDRDIIRRSADAQLVKYLDANGGIRIYRDGVRVYNYGERDDNWLGLDLRRVNIPTLRISRNIILGAIHLSLRDSPELMERTNREGFVENDALDRLRSIVLGAIATFEPERRSDKERIRRETQELDDSPTDRVVRMFAQLRRSLDKEGRLETFAPRLARIERGYETMQEVLTKAGISGLNLALVFHEVDRGVRALYNQIVEGVDRDVLAEQARHLTELLDGFSGLLRRGKRKKHSLAEIVLAAQQIHSLRLARHQVGLDSFLPDHDVGNSTRDHSPFSKIYFHLAVGALNNLIDNAIYWLKVRWPETAANTRKLYIGLSDDFDFGPALVVADNGIGLQGDDPHNLTRPFFTRRPTGMGLGLYYVNLAMELCGGRCVFPRPHEVSLPGDYDGAVVALLFKGV